MLADLLNDLFMFDPYEMTWTNLTNSVRGTPPSPRERHGFTSTNGTLFVFGGSGQWDIHHQTVYLNDFYQLDPISMEWTNMTDLCWGNLPTPRASFGFASTENKLYVFGGSDQDLNG